MVPADYSDVCQSARTRWDDRGRSEQLGLDHHCQPGRPGRQRSLDAVSVLVSFVRVRLRLGRARRLTSTPCCRAAHVPIRRSGDLLSGWRLKDPSSPLLASRLLQDACSSVAGIVDVPGRLACSCNGSCNKVPSTSGIYGV